MSDPREWHDRDQLFAAIVEIAGAHARYYRALIDEGMEPDDALVVIGYLAADAFRGGRDKDEGSW